jgi:hypothetical protein
MRARRLPDRCTQARSHDAASDHTKQVVGLDSRLDRLVVGTEMVEELA